ncbi:hypothetical protein [Dyella sp. C11]|uniref:hypothetical protein n=1 Tax=Dyella sp. C11 TaxID=2126991 RepID=UPI000D643BD9|nr:hypothetical protein [Dyella sp. C11]
MAVVFESPALVVSTSRVAYWCMEGLRVWRRYPLRLFLLCLAPMVLEALLQLIPLVGVALSKVFPLLLSFGVFQGLVAAEASGVLRWSSPFSTWQHGYRWRALGLALLCGPLVFGVQQGVAAAVYGWPAVDAVLLGHMSAHPELANRLFICLLILPGTPVAIWLALAPMFVMFRGATPWQAMRSSVAVMLRSPGAFATYALIQLLLMAGLLLIPWGMLLLLALLPWMSACWLVIWKDIDKGEGTP